MAGLGAAAGREQQGGAQAQVCVCVNETEANNSPVKVWLREPSQLPVCAMHLQLEPVSAGGDLRVGLKWKEEFSGQQLSSSQPPTNTVVVSFVLLIMRSNHL